MRCNVCNGAHLTIKCPKLNPPEPKVEPKAEPKVEAASAKKSRQQLWKARNLEKMRKRHREYMREWRKRQK